MKKKQTYIIGGETPKQKKPNNKKRTVKKNSSSHKYESKPKHQINNPFIDAFAKAGLTPESFKKK